MLLLPAIAASTEKDFESFIAKLRDGALLVAHPDTLDAVAAQLSDPYLFTAFHIALSEGRVIPNRFVKLGELYAVAKPSPPERPLFTVEFPWFYLYMRRYPPFSVFATCV